MKVLFYLVLQSIDAEMAAKLQQNLASVEPSDSELFKKMFDILFGYAIERTGDFEEVFKTDLDDYKGNLWGSSKAFMTNKLTVSGRR